MAYWRHWRQDLPRGLLEAVAAGATAVIQPGGSMRDAEVIAAADAAFVQPFDDLKLFSNIAVSWLVLGFAPEGSYWLGIVLIAGASSYLLWSERNGRFGAAQPA